MQAISSVWYLMMIFGPAIAGFLGQPQPGITLDFGGDFGGVIGEARKSLSQTKLKVFEVIPFEQGLMFFTPHRATPRNSRSRLQKVGIKGHQP